MNASLIWSLVRGLLDERSAVEIDSDKIQEILEAKVSAHEIQTLLSQDSDSGPIHCRLVDVIDIHHWTLRFWKERERSMDREDTDSHQPLRAA